MASSLSGSPIDRSSDVARSSCCKTMRLISFEISGPGFRRNPTTTLLRGGDLEPCSPVSRNQVMSTSPALVRKSADSEQPGGANREQRTGCRKNDADFDGGKQRSGRQ